ncbi:MAG: hypothetical protein ACKPGI_18455 [Verrucomicrobiota bacterium]
MASIRRHPKSRYWYACYQLPDGRPTQRSTKQTDATKARKIAEQFEKAAQAGKNARLTELQARKVISDIYAIANPTKMKAATIRKFLKEWLTARGRRLVSTEWLDGTIVCVTSYLPCLLSK